LHEIFDNASATLVDLYGILALFLHFLMAFIWSHMKLQGSFHASKGAGQSESGILWLI